MRQCRCLSRSNSYYQYCSLFTLLRTRRLATTTDEQLSKVRYTRMLLLFIIIIIRSYYASSYRSRIHYSYSYFLKYTSTRYTGWVLELLFSYRANTYLVVMVVVCLNGHDDRCAPSNGLGTTRS